MARVTPVAPAEYTSEVRAAFATLSPPNARHRQPKAQGRPTAANMLGTLAHHPALANAYCTLNGHLLMNTTLSERRREMIILRVGAVRQATYEWAQHLSLASDAGLSDVEIGAVAFGPSAPVWDDDEAAILRGVDELLLDNEISLPTWETLAAHLTIQQILDLIVTVGTYDTMSRLTKSLRVELDSDLQEFITSAARGGTSFASTSPD